ncbi:hypothetical protein OGAPHI_003496 [Ogataea philodendri]|uniref:Uncharacterized protein n=1 Tax=Ogataea philodendri TaxID=1378263 RepID=A0A9P8T5W8_9ASCO|nr:uncharacterized protein OGAPHI_003496 [Ogataea philodendri]KAH3666500.1 hypothetical protein OGAPHI_003496 [Ogataea philodendri]
MAASLAKAVMSDPENESVNWINSSRSFSEISISSTKIIDGASRLANWNSALTSFSDSPKYLEVKEDAEIEKKVDFDSVATARASMVLPVPGGPNNNIPRAGSLNPLKRSGLKNG